MATRLTSERPRIPVNLIHGEFFVYSTLTSKRPTSLKYCRAPKQSHFRETKKAVTICVCVTVWVLCDYLGTWRISQKSSQALRARYRSKGLTIWECVTIRSVTIWRLYSKLFSYSDRKVTFDFSTFCRPCFKQYARCLRND